MSSLPQCVCTGEAAEPARDVQREGEKKDVLLLRLAPLAACVWIGAAPASSRGSEMGIAQEQAHPFTLRAPPIARAAN
jgi:hypothetical protein